jgi:predicted transcriptional regulator
MAKIISVEEVRDKLTPLTMAQLEKLASLSGVSVHGIYKIRIGVVPNPGLETVGKFWSHIREAKRS